MAPLYSPGPGSFTVDAGAGYLGEAPGVSAGLLDYLRTSAGGWPGPDHAEGSRAGAYLAAEKAHSGPAGVVLPWFLPFYDDKTGETPEMRLAYRRMLAEPNVKSALLDKILAVSALDLRVHPAEKHDPVAQQVAEFVEWNWEEALADSVPGLVWSILSGGLVDGYSVCEKIFAREEQGRYAGLWPLAALKPKDVGQDLILKTDSFRNVVSVMGLRYNAGQELSPANFLIYRYLPLFDTPTGMSDLRAAYRPYWMLDTVEKLRAMALEKRAIPFLLGEYQTSDQQPAVERALSLVKSQNWAAVPGNVKVTALNIAGASDSIYDSAIKSYKHEIFLSIQGAVLQSLEGTITDGRGNSLVHERRADLLVWYLSSTVQALLNNRRHGLIRDIVDLNFSVNEYPRAKLSSVDLSELAQDLQIDRGLIEMGIDLSREEMYERYGRTPPMNVGDRVGMPQAPPPGAPQGGGGGGGAQEVRPEDLPPEVQEMLAQYGGGGGAVPHAEYFDEDERPGRGPLPGPARVLCHVSGAPGSGKSTLGEELASLHPQLTVKDLDDFDEAAKGELGLEREWRADFTDADVRRLRAVKQQMLDAFLAKAGGPVVLVGVHADGPHGSFVGTHPLRIPAARRFFLDVDPEVSARRDYERGKDSEPPFTRRPEDVPAAVRNAIDIRADCLRRGYEPASAGQIREWVGRYAEAPGGAGAVPHAEHFAEGDEGDPGPAPIDERELSADQRTERHRRLDRIRDAQRRRLDRSRGGEGRAEQHAEVESFCQEGVNKGKPGPCPKPRPAGAPKASRGSPRGEVAGKKPSTPNTVEGLLGHIEAVRSGAGGTVGELTERLAAAPKAHLEAIKRSLGLRAGGSKPVMARKIAEQSTARLSEREGIVREARKAGVPQRELFAAAARVHKVQREFTDGVRAMLAETRKLYSAENRGKVLSRSMRAFRGGDRADIRGFDAIARAMADRYPELLGAHGYEHGDNDERPAADRLYDFLNAGTPPPPRREDSWREALESLRGQPRGTGQRRSERYTPSEEPIPFAEYAPDDRDALLDCMLDAALAGDRRLLGVLGDMLEEASHEPDGLGEEGSEGTRAAEARVLAQRRAFAGRTTAPDA